MLRLPAANRKSHPRRTAGITSITALLLIPLLAMLAFAIDLGYIWRADAELQTAADSAALAGASQLFSYAVQANQSGLSATQRGLLQSAAIQQVRTRARTFVGYHTAGGVPLVVNDSDITIGYIADPTVPPSQSGGTWLAGATDPFPNSVQVVVRRDQSVSTGPLGLFFGRTIGTPTSERSAASVASLRGTNVTGFVGTGSRMLPIAMSIGTLNALLGSASPPAGVVLQDNYTVTLPAAGGAVPPSNVTAGGDGVSEASIFPATTTPGNFGMLSLHSGKESSASVYDQWITSGPTAADLATFGPSGLQAGMTLSGGPGLKASEDSPLKSIIGVPHVMPVYDTYAGSGANTTYHIVSFVGATVVAVDLKGGSKYVQIQLTPVTDPTATLGSGGNAVLVYRGVSLTR